MNDAERKMIECLKHFEHEYRDLQWLHQEEEEQIALSRGAQFFTPDGRTDDAKTKIRVHPSPGDGGDWVTIQIIVKGHGQFELLMNLSRTRRLITRLEQAMVAVAAGKPTPEE
jgi:hypothetical protein